MWQVTAVNLRQVPGDWESDVLILQFGQLRPKAGISLLQGTQWGSDTMQIKAEVSELIAWVFPANCEVLTALLLLPPLECGTNWSECQWPACQHVFWSCIFPELATFSRKKKVLFLTTQGNKRYFAPSVTSKDTTHEWGHGHYMSMSIPTRGCWYSLMESHKHGCLLTHNLSLNPRSQPTRISWDIESPTLWLWAVSLVKLSKSL